MISSCLYSFRINSINQSTLVLSGIVPTATRISCVSCWNDYLITWLRCRWQYFNHRTSRTKFLEHRLWKCYLQLNWAPESEMNLLIGFLVLENPKMEVLHIYLLQLLMKLWHWHFRAAAILDFAQYVRQGGNWACLPADFDRSRSYLATVKTS